MKKIKFLIGIVIVGALSSCSDYLDINDNPNQATAVTPDLILPQALTTTAGVLNVYNNYGSQIGGYAANAGGFGGFNELVTYAYTPNNYGGLWSSAFDNAEDYQFIINQTEGDAANIYYNAVAKIMKAHNFQLLVDVYNDVPYSEALKGAEELTPKYDDGATIYASLASLLDEAITEINTGLGAAVAPKSIEAKDVVFKGDMTNWIKFANTLKLKLIIRADGKATFANTNFDPAGFLTTDALVNPGYKRGTAGAQNPAWETWGWTGSGTTATKSWIPSAYTFAFYNGYKLTDPVRGAAIFYQFPNTGTNRLGHEGNDIAKSPDGSFWYSGSNRTAAGGATTKGVVKSPEVGYPLFTAAESYFLVAEAALRGGLVTADAKTSFENGIKASFVYVGTTTADATAYIAANANYLVQFDLAADNADKLEAIITQKYIALNMVHSHEGWNEYRRTGYPVSTGSLDYTTFASFASQSTRPDKLPTRIQYPLTEIQYNGENVPQSINVFSSLIFWAK